MILTEVTAVPSAALPLAELAAHLRLGSGFALPEGQEGLMESHLRAAMAAIEGRIAKALLIRRFRWEVAVWRDSAEVALPLAPVGEVISLTMTDASGAEVEVTESRWRLISDAHRPRLAGRGGALPEIPSEGRAVVLFDAGFAADWGDLPGDLRQAVLLLAAEFYEHRHDDGSSNVGLPPVVATLIERWRLVRVLGGGGRK